MKMYATLLVNLLLTLHMASAQRIIDPTAIACAETEGGVHVTPLYSDSTASSFLICIDAEVQAHVHRVHTEHVFVIDGEALMRLGEEQRSVKAGDTIIIPPGTVHSARVTSKVPLRVISVQAPYFDGSDRVMIPQER